MAQPLVSDALWAKIKPLLPPPKPRRFRFPGRKPLDPRKALTGIIFVLKSGIPWELLPQEMSRALRSNEPLCVAMLDLDHFKLYNDDRGHQTGDRLLKQVAGAWS